METQVQNPTKVATKWALISLLFAIIITYAIQLLNMDINSPVKYLGYVPFLGGLFLTQKEYRDVIGGYMTFGEGFSAGFRYAIFNGLLLAVFTYLYLAILSPDYFIKSLDAVQTKLSSQGMSQEQIDKTLEITKKWGPIGGAFGIAIWYAIVGALVSLIGAAIFKRERSALEIAEAAEDNPTIDPTV